MNSAERAIRNRLHAVEAADKKQILISLEEDTIDRMDQIARTLARRTGQSTSRNALIEEAVGAYVQEALRVFAEEGIDMDVQPEAEAYDTVVFPAHQEGFQEAFLEENQWYWVRVRKDRIVHLRYIAIYVGSPVSKITHYARIAPNGFVYDETERKYRILFDGQAIALDRPVALGGVSAAATRAPRYTTLAKLLAAETYGDL